MKRDDVKVGGTYAMTVGGKAVPVRITDEKWKGDKHVGSVRVKLTTTDSHFRKVDRGQFQSTGK